VQIDILSGGAAQGLVSALAPQFKGETGCDIAGTYSAVGSMRDKLIAGASADLVILTSALIAGLAHEGHVTESSVVDIGIVRTGIAVRDSDPKPPISDAQQLRAAQRAADAVYFPDPKLATAGVHFSRVLAALQIGTELAPRLRPFPNGATAMRELAAAMTARPIGCTQVTEILATPGVSLVGSLPGEFELATIYTAAVATRARRPREARHLAAMLASEAARDVRIRIGFEPLG